MVESLVINEIYLSLQGESSWAGWPCVFVRLTGCNLRCSYCDTAYAFGEGRRMTFEAVLDRVAALATPFSGVHGAQRLPIVELTGGEPLLQAGVRPLMTRLCDAAYTVLLETSGALDITPVDPRVHRIMDWKCPSSGEAGRNLPENLAALRPTDELKFVVGTETDYAWMKEVLERHELACRCPVLVSWVAPLLPEQRHATLKPVPAFDRALSRSELAERILADALPVRFQVQMHKVIWSPAARGV
jgi:7-carboxy-7-deazaguanine synthase